MSKGINLSKTILDSFVGTWGEQYTMVLQTLDVVAVRNPRYRWWKFWEPKTVPENVWVDVATVQSAARRSGPQSMEFEPMDFGPLPRSLRPNSRIRMDGYTGIGLATFPIDPRLMPIAAGDTLHLEPRMELR
jgi:hypothetical protein